jgi:type II secretory pathway pseudopilin PulG
MFFGHFHHRSRQKLSNQESGYMLIVIIFLMVGMMIAALAMAPAITTQIKRDREQEFIHRGAQYARAVKKYHKKFGRYPPTLEALEDTNHMRFLRKRYKDPLVESGKWELVRFGQVQFNAANRQGGTGGLSGGGTGLPNVPGVTGLLTGQNSQNQSPQNTFGQQSTNSAPGGIGTSGSSFGNSNNSGSSFGNSSNTGSSFGQSTTGTGNQPLGGGAIIGVASTSEKESLGMVDDKNHYKDWKFVYDPTFDKPGMLINGPYDPKKQMGQFGQQPGQQIGTPAGQPSSTGFSSPGGSSFGQPSQGPMQQPTMPPDQPVQPNPR